MDHLADGLNVVVATMFQFQVCSRVLTTDVVYIHRYYLAEFCSRIWYPGPRQAPGLARLSVVVGRSDTTGPGLLPSILQMTVFTPNFGRDYLCNKANNRNNCSLLITSPASTKLARLR